MIGKLMTFVYEFIKDAQMTEINVSKGCKRKIPDVRVLHLMFL